MRNLTSAPWMYLKAALLLVAGSLASALLLADRPTLKNLALLGIAVWSFCRLYYFAFYVMEHYVDKDYRFSGLASFARHLCKRR
jgi:hypothetical protein